MLKDLGAFAMSAEGQLASSDVVFIEWESQVDPLSCPVLSLNSLPDLPTCLFLSLWDVCQHSPVSF